MLTYTDELSNDLFHQVNDLEDIQDYLDRIIGNTPNLPIKQQIVDHLREAARHVQRAIDDLATFDDEHNTERG